MDLYSYVKVKVARILRVGILKIFLGLKGKIKIKIKIIKRKS